MDKKLNMIYWKDTDFFVGKILESPDIMTQGETIEELEDNLKDAYTIMNLDDIPEKYDTKELILNV